MDSPDRREARLTPRGREDSHAEFFYRAPDFLDVISLIITLAGALAMFNLPIAQYPQIVPPQVQVSTSFPGANAQVVAESIAAPIEQQVNGAKSIRTQGYPCQTVKAMQRMESADPAIRAAWQVHCTEGDYAVVYRGNLGYQVRPLH